MEGEDEMLVVVLLLELLVLLLDPGTGVARLWYEPTMEWDTHPSCSSQSCSTFSLTLSLAVDARGVAGAGKAICRLVHAQ